MLALLSAGLFVAVAGISAAMGLRFWARQQRAVDRITRRDPRPGAHPSLAWHELVKSLGNALPASPANAGAMRRMLMRAGIRSASAVSAMYGAKVLCAVVVPAATAILLWTAAAWPDYRALVTAGSAAAGFFLPDRFIRMRAERRQKAIRKGLPNALDLLVVCVESGLGLDHAILHVAKELRAAHPDISDEFALMNLEMKAGKRRAEALRNLADRNAVEELGKLSAMLIQTDRFGTSVAQGLRTHSEYLRVQARQRAEEKAAKLAIKLIFPIFFFILPSLFVVTVGPMLARIIRELLPLLKGI